MLINDEYSGTQKKLSINQKKLKIRVVKDMCEDTEKQQKHMQRQKGEMCYM